VSRVAAIPEVRKLLVSLQKKMGASKGVVMDGRDIGTVVFPDAELKLFMTASPDTRAKRRYDELLAKGEEVTYQAILDNVIYRDHLDTTREDSPLTKAIDAVEIDNSQLTREAQAKKIYDLTLQILRKYN
jgi:cytidylate kinase